MPTDDASATCEVSRNLLPTKVRFILEIWRYIPLFHMDVIAYLSVPETSYKFNWYILIKEAPTWCTAENDDYTIVLVQ